MTKTSCIIRFGSDAIEIKDDASFSVTVGNEASIGDVDDLELRRAERYATYEPNFWLLDGSYKFAPAIPHGGYVSGSQSDGSGNFSANSKVQIDFSTTHSTNGLKLTFSTVTGEYMSSIKVTFYDSSYVSIRSDTYSPTSNI